MPRMLTLSHETVKELLLDSRLPYFNKTILLSHRLLSLKDFPKSVYRELKIILIGKTGEYMHPMLVIFEFILCPNYFCQGEKIGGLTS